MDPRFVLSNHVREVWSKNGRYNHKPRERGGSAKKNSVSHGHEGLLYRLSSSFASIGDWGVTILPE